MERLIILTALLFSVMAGLAQWSSRATIEFSAGGSFPIGEFAYSRFDYEESGFAEAGIALAVAWSAGAGYTYQYAEKITLSLRLDFFMTHPVLEDNWSSDFSTGSYKISYKLSIVNLTAGLGFRIF